ncbi:hypothetical protein GQ600_20658 [Phytophthora cactorum]|nr:hypothetical protein GQ600_20658 [Phytophthora cactorum]
MGHPSCRECDEFTALKENAGNNQTYHICNHCNNAYRASRPTAEEAIGKAADTIWPPFKLALLQTQQFVRLVQCILKLPAQRQCAHAMTTHLQHEGLHMKQKREIFMRLIVKFQADNRLPDSFIERLSTVRLLHRVSKMIADIFPLLSHK